MSATLLSAALAPMLKRGSPVPVIATADVSAGTDRGAPYVASPVVYQGIVYLVKDSGILTALDASTGQVLKQGRLKGRGNYYSSPVVVDSKLYAASEPGVVTVVDVQERPTVGNQWPILAWHDFQEPIYATPQIDGGRMYVRTGSAIYAFGRNTEGEQLRK